MGAMGFTHEHVLHHYTRRLWVWRRDFGSESFWGEKIGAAYAKAGPDATLALDGATLTVRDGAAVRTLDLATVGPLVGEGTFDPPTTPLDKDGQGTPYATYAFAAQMAEVEVDIELGTVKVLRIVAAHETFARMTLAWLSLASLVLAARTEPGRLRRDADLLGDRGVERQVLLDVVVVVLDAQCALGEAWEERDDAADDEHGCHRHGVPARARRPVLRRRSGDRRRGWAEGLWRTQRSGAHPRVRALPLRAFPLRHRSRARAQAVTPAAQPRRSGSILARLDLRAEVSMRRRFVLSVVLAVLAWSGSALAADPVEGEDYLLVQTPLPPADPARIVVTDFFSYACPHCFAFSPDLRSWESKLPPDVVLDRVEPLMRRGAIPQILTRPLIAENRILLPVSQPWSPSSFPPLRRWAANW